MYSFCVHECVVTYFYLIIVIGPVVDCGERACRPEIIIYYKCCFIYILYSNTSQAETY